MSTRLVSIANPESPRWRAFAEEWRNSAAGPEPTLIPWADFIRADGDLGAFRLPDESAWLRVESPGRDEAVAGLLAGTPLPSRTALHEPRRAHVRFARLMARLEEQLRDRPDLRPTARPTDLAAMFDKLGTFARLRAAGVPVPDVLDTQSVDDPFDLWEALRKTHWPRAYAKLNTGSSAVGTLVIDELSVQHASAFTTMTWRDGAVHNTRRLERVTGDDLDALVAFLVIEGLCVTRGIEPVRLDEANVDLRVVTIAGEPAFLAARLSAGPLTNLHLGGRRGDAARLRATLPPRSWLDGLDACRAAAGCFDALVVGVDLLFERTTCRPVILEANAFGDWLPGVTDPAGRGVHRGVIDALRLLPPVPSPPALRGRGLG